MLFRSNDTATTEIYTSIDTLSLHDALPIYLVFRMIRFRMILTFTSRITTINGRKIEMVRISFLLLVSRRGYSRRLFLFGGRV